MNWKFLSRSLGVILLFMSAGFAQDQRSEVNVQGIAAITQSTNSLISPYSATKSGGFLAGYRYHLSRWFAIEGDYAHTRNTQNFFDPLTLGAGVQTNIHELTGEAVITTSGRRIRPYFLAGAGGLFFRPTNSASNLLLGLGNSLGISENQSRFAFVYGGGLDFNLTRNIALRGEYRGLVFHAPGFDIPGLSGIGLGSLSNLVNPGFTHMAQPSVGLVFRF